MSSMMRGGVRRLLPAVLLAASVAAVWTAGAQPALTALSATEAMIPMRDGARLYTQVYFHGRPDLERFREPPGLRRVLATPGIRAVVDTGHRADAECRRLRLLELSPAKVPPGGWERCPDGVA